MAWVYLALAAAFEILFAVSMKYSDGFTKLLPSVATAIGVIGGLTFLALALKELPVSVAYPIWTSAGVIGTVLLGFVFLGEALPVQKIICIAVIVAGVAGLRAYG